MYGLTKTFLSVTSVGHSKLLALSRGQSHTFYVNLCVLLIDFQRKGYRELYKKGRVPKPCRVPGWVWSGNLSILILHINPFHVTISFPPKFSTYVFSCLKFCWLEVVLSETIKKLQPSENLWVSSITFFCLHFLFCHIFLSSFIQTFCYTKAQY